MGVVTSPMTDDPINLFRAWLAEAEGSEPNDANAMTLATIDPDGRPSARIVLLKDVDEKGGFTFHTNSLSRKGAALAAHPVAALVFHWKSLRRQVRVEGEIAAAPTKESDDYFATRGRESQISAWASQQSQPLDSRDTLLSRQAQMIEKFDGEAVTRPPHWHGFRLTPRRIELWSDGANRLHHRRLFTREEADGDWTEGLLYP